MRDARIAVGRAERLAAGRWASTAPGSGPRGPEPGIFPSTYRAAAMGSVHSVTVASLPSGITYRAEDSVSTGEHDRGQLLPGRVGEIVPRSACLAAGYRREVASPMPPERQDPRGLEDRAPGVLWVVANVDRQGVGGPNPRALGEALSWPTSSQVNNSPSSPFSLPIPPQLRSFGTPPRSARAGVADPIPSAAPTAVTASRHFPRVIITVPFVRRPPGSVARATIAFSTSGCPTSPNSTSTGNHIGSPSGSGKRRSARDGPDPARVRHGHTGDSLSLAWADGPWVPNEGGQLAPDRAEALCRSHGSGPAGTHFVMARMDNVARMIG